MKETVLSVRMKSYLRPFANSLVFISIIALQVVIIWNLGVMLYGNEEDSTEKELSSEEQIEELRIRQRTMNKNKFNERRFEIEVVQPQKEMLEKFSRHPNLVFGKLTKTIQKEEQRIRNIRKGIYDLKSKLGITTLEPKLEKSSAKDDVNAMDHGSKNSSSWIWTASNFFGRKLQQASANNIDSNMGFTEGYDIFKSSLKSKHHENFHNDNKIITTVKQDNELVIYRQCPETSPLLLGPLYVQQYDIPKLRPGTDEFLQWYGYTITNGGASKPENCIARQKVAIIVPYRDRDENLNVFLHHLHPILQRQQLDYRIFVVEQSADGEDFNRAALMNVGYAEASKIDHYFCYVFHDVDLLPEDDRNMYLCPPDSSKSVKHLSVAINKWKYRLQYQDYFGGVSAISKESFKKMNGFPNGFYGWGGEDDELAQRTNQTNLTITRQPGNIARYTMLMHDGATSNKNVRRLMHLSKDLKLLDDGLTTLRYKVLRKDNMPLYTRILVKLPAASEMPEKFKALYFGDEDNNNKEEKPETPSDSPFVIALLQNMGNSFKELGKLAAQEAVLYSLKHAETIENERKEVY